METHKKYLDKNWLRKKYAKTSSVVKIAKECRVAITTISRWLENFEIRKKRNYKGNKKGPNNSFWGGGKYKDGSNGYILAYSPDHPHATKKGYVREHRLVMENFLGRYLRGNEIVHHKNKRRDDNRIKNLELIVVGEVNGGNIACPHCNKVFKLS